MPDETPEEGDIGESAASYLRAMNMLAIGQKGQVADDVRGVIAKWPSYIEDLKARGQEADAVALGEYMAEVLRTVANVFDPPA